MQQRKQAFRERQGVIPLSKLAQKNARSVSKKRRPYLDTSIVTNPKMFRAANQTLRKEGVGAVEDIWQKEGGSLKDKFF